MSAIPSPSAALLRTIEAMANVKVLCIGDVMLDRFMYGVVDRISPESPIPVFTHQREEKMLGGAGNVVRGVLALGADAGFLSVIGDDTVGNQLTALVGSEARLHPYLLSEKNRLSTKKTRYVASGQQLLRADAETRAPISAASEQKLLAAALAELPQYHVLILSDYGKGVLTPSLCRALIDAANAQSIPVLVDPKHRDIGVYAGATILSPNLKEMAAAVGVEQFASEAELVAAAAALCAKHHFTYILCTRGKDGMVLINAAGEVARVATAAREVFDVSGAGDTAIATLAVSLAAGATAEEAMVLANSAAGVAVGRLGTAVVHQSDLITALFLSHTALQHQKILPLSYAEEMVKSWRREGQRIGFTNGCFDIMHAGHATLLADARAQCDKLIVGINSDASVKRLKGESRPVNQEFDRAHLLASLACVDAVIIFEEDTPLALIRALKPDILMKGADYTRETVVGYEIVESYGGKVVLLPLKEGYSTSNIIRKVTSAA